MAVSLTTTAAATAEVVGSKLPRVTPAGMFTVAGTVTAGTVSEDRLLDKAMSIPPAGAAVERLIRQTVGLPPVSENGLQPKKVMLGRLEFPAGGVSVIDATWEEPL